MDRIRIIIIVGSHPLLRAAFRAALEAEQDLRVVGEASSTEAAIDLTRQVDADVVLLDLTVPGPIDLATLRKLKLHQPALPVLVVVGHGHEAGPAMEAGAAGYFSGNDGGQRVAEVIRGLPVRISEGMMTTLQAAIVGTFDHAEGPEQMRQIDRALRFYFGANDWLKARDEAMPAMRRTGPPNRPDEAR